MSAADAIDWPFGQDMEARAAVRSCRGNGRFPYTANRWSARLKPYSIHQAAGRLDGDRETFHADGDRLGHWGLPGNMPAERTDPRPDLVKEELTTQSGDRGGSLGWRARATDCPSS